MLYYNLHGNNFHIKLKNKETNVLIYHFFSKTSGFLSVIK